MCSVGHSHMAEKTAADDPDRAFPSGPISSTEGHPRTSLQTRWQRP